MQPVQDLTVEDRVSRTQYQYTLEDADPERAAPLGAEAGRRAASDCPSCATSPAISRTAGCKPRCSIIDRDTASRLGHHHRRLIDDTLYDAFGQRQVSTIFTQLNQYRVILEVKPEFQQRPGRAARASTCDRTAGGAGAA